MKINVAKLTLYCAIILTVGFAMLLTTMVGGYILLHQYAVQRPPSRAANITLEPKSPPMPLCPGDAIPYTFGATPLRIPVVARISTTLWSHDLNQTIIEQRVGMQELRIWTTSGEITNEENYTIPYFDRYGRPLIAGEYEIRHAVVAEGTAPSTFSLRFHIDEVCPDAPPEANDG